MRAVSLETSDPVSGTTLAADANAGATAIDAAMADARAVFFMLRLPFFELTQVLATGSYPDFIRPHPARRVRPVLHYPYVIFFDTETTFLLFLRKTIRNRIFAVQSVTEHS